MAAGRNAHQWLGWSLNLEFSVFVFSTFLLSGKLPHLAPRVFWYHGAAGPNAHHQWLGWGLDFSVLIDFSAFLVSWKLPHLAPRVFWYHAAAGPNPD